MSAVLTRPPSALYREEQLFAWWVYVVLALLALAITLGLNLLTNWHPATAFPFGWPSPQSVLSLLLGVALPGILVVAFLRMTTEVSPDSCCVTFGFFPTLRHLIPLAEITSVEIVTYDAIRQHGFWGIRTTADGERVFTARGNTAVRIRLQNGTHALIGTQRPADLAALLQPR